MKLFRRSYWYLSEFIKKHKVVLLLGVVIGALFVANADTLVNAIPTTKTFYIGRVGNITLSELPTDIQQLMSQGLTQISEDGSAINDLAASIDISENGTVYTVKLKPNLVWSNGEPLMSKDFSLQLPDVSISTPDDKTIVFTLSQPYAPFPVILSQPLLKRVDFKVGMAKKTHIIGTKTYKLTKIISTNQYIDELELESETERRIYRFYPTEAEAVTAFKLGKIDQIDFLTSPQLEDWPNVELIHNDRSTRYLSLFFNTADPDLQNKTVRQMLTYATPKKTDEARVISPISKRSWAYNPQVKPYAHNLETAASMHDKLVQGNAKTLNFELTTTPAYADMAQRIADSWQQIGVTTKLKVVAFPDTENYQVLLIGQQIPDDPDQYLLWHSTQPTNITKYQNPKIDKLLEDGRKQLDQEKRKQIYQEFQRFLVEDSPAAFLHELHTYTIKRL